MTTPDGEERVRGALWLEAPFGNEASAIGVVTNSVLPCEAEVSDDPDTVTDESAEALGWWGDTVEAAMAREGSVVVVMFLANASGDYALGTGGAPAAAYRVDESSWTSDGRQVDAYTLDDARRGDATVDASGDTQVLVDFAFDGWAAAVPLDRCDNDRLVNAVLGLYYAM